MGTVTTDAAVGWGTAVGGAGVTVALAVIGLVVLGVVMAKYRSDIVALFS